MKNLNTKQKSLFLVGLFTLLIFVVGATYAYFSIGINNTTTNTSLGGTTNNYGTASLTTNTSKLYLKFTSDEMSEDYKGTTYFANSNSSGTPLTKDPNYTLAIASLTDGDLAVDCTYNFKVTASVNKAISDNSDSDVKITIGNTTKTLKELIAAGTSGVIVSGKISNLVTGTSQTISISSSVTNSTSNQSGLAGNSYTITITPYTSGNTKSFSCKLKEKTFADKLISGGKLWQSGLEGDGYRYVGSGAAGDSTNPNNFICFGTYDMSECTANQDKYMYRIIGVFAADGGENHVKLIKYTQLDSAYAWNDDNSVDIPWEDSDLYKGLNGRYFLTNTNYDYLQDTTWSNRIENWTWNAVNTKTYEDKTNNTDYYKSSSTGIYLNEMHKTSTGTLCTNSNNGAINCNGGTWTNPVAKIGLMYASDYVLSLGSSALALTSSSNSDTLATGWMHQNNNDTFTDTYDWTLARCGTFGGSFVAWRVHDSGSMADDFVNYAFGARPVFYLTCDVIITTNGDGSLENPFIISE